MNNTLDKKTLEEFLKIGEADLTTEKLLQVAGAYARRNNTLESINDGSANAATSMYKRQKQMQQRRSQPPQQPANKAASGSVTLPDGSNPDREPATTTKIHLYPLAYISQKHSRTSAADADRPHTSGKTARWTKQESNAHTFQSPINDHWS